MATETENRYPNEPLPVSTAKRAFNRASSAQLLEHHGVQFESKNNGAHLIINYSGIVVDFWPGTGKWIVRAGATVYEDSQGRGVFPLLKRLGIKRCQR